MTQTEKYIWLINTIFQANEITLEDLCRKWMDKMDIHDDPRDFLKKKFHPKFFRWVEDIGLQFGITIKCRRKGGYKYYIENPEVIEKNLLNQWMLDTISTGTLIKDNFRISHRILVNSIPSGRDHLSTILEAMKQNRKIEIDYRPFGNERSFYFAIEPYCVKLFENRWYVLARNNRNEIKLYGLDRIEYSCMIDETFELPKDFDASEYFSKFFGIIIGQSEEPERIVIRANMYHKHYMMTLPMHHSQRLIEDYGEYADFELHLVPSFDFEMKLLQQGSYIEVLEPESLRKALKGWSSEIYELYKDS